MAQPLLSVASLVSDQALACLVRDGGNRGSVVVSDRCPPCTALIRAQCVGSASTCPTPVPSLPSFVPLGWSPGGRRGARELATRYQEPSRPFHQVLPYSTKSGQCLSSRSLGTPFPLSEEGDAWEWSRVLPLRLPSLRVRSPSGGAFGSNRPSSPSCSVIPHSVGGEGVPGDRG